MASVLRVTINDGSYVSDFLLTGDEDENGLHELVLLDANGTQVEHWPNLDRTRALRIIDQSLAGAYVEAMFPDADEDRALDLRDAIITREEH